MKFKKIPCHNLADYKIFIIIALSILTINNAITMGFSAIQQVLVAVIVAGIIDAIFIKWHSKNWYFPSGAMISAMIIALLINPSDIKNTVFVVIISLILKHVVSYKHRNIFNPAALAIVVSSFFLPIFSAWWGAAGIITFIVGLILVIIIKRWTTALGFLLPYLVLFAIRDSLSGNFVLTLSLLAGPPAFFAFFMVIEPVTTPKTDKKRIIFGLSVAVLAFIFSFFPWMMGNSFFLYGSLLTMNLIMRILPNHMLE